MKAKKRIVNTLAAFALSCGFSLSIAQGACVTATVGGGWVNTTFTSQAGSFTATFDATPTAAPTNAVVGLSNGAQTAYANFACLVRFNPTGSIDARNGGAYAAASTIPYSAGASYHFRLVVNVPANTYSIFVTPAGGSELTVGTNYAFRISATALNWYGVFVDTSASGGAGSVTVCNYTIGTGGGGSSLTGSSTDGFHSLAMSSAQSGSFTATFDATPSVSPENAVVGLSQGAATAYGTLSCIARFNPTGQIDAYNGTAYAAASSINYSAGVSYHFRLVVNVPAHTYSVFVTPAGGSELTVGSNFAFRTTVTSLDTWDLDVNATPAGASLTASNLSVTGSGGGGTASTPSFSPAAGTYGSAQSISITTTTSGASIRYTTNGSTPSNTAGTLYSGPVNISATTTLKAIAYASGLTNSAVASGTYTIGTGTNFTPAQVLAGVQSHMTSSVQVNTKPHTNTMTRAMNVNVYQVTTGVFAYTSSMAIDDDGSDSDPDPDHQGETTWQDSSGAQLGAHHVPFYVLGDDCWDNESKQGGNFHPCPHFYYPEHSITGLQFALMFYNGSCIGAVFGDTQTANGQTTSINDARELGEASVKAASLLGIPSSGTTGGVDNGVTVVIFSGSQWVVKGTNQGTGPVGSATGSLNGNAQALVQKALNQLGSSLGL